MQKAKANHAKAASATLVKLMEVASEEEMPKLQARLDKLAEMANNPGHANTPTGAKTNATTPGSSNSRGKHKNNQ